MKKTSIVLLIFLAACVYPQDPEHSFQNAKKSGLMVGVVDNPPYTSVSGETFNGIEIDLLREFAQKEDLQLQFIEGSESDLMEYLEKFKLHVIAGGFTKKTIWKNKAGLTAPYDKNHVLLIPKGENRLLFHMEAFIFQKNNTQ